LYVLSSSAKVEMLVLQILQMYFP